MPQAFELVDHQTNGRPRSSGSTTSASLDDALETDRLTQIDPVGAHFALPKVRTSDGADSNGARRALRGLFRRRHGSRTFNAYDPEQQKSFSRLRGFAAPTRLCCLSALVLVVIFIALGSGGGAVWVYKKGTLDGSSPPWYPSPRGGTLESWARSYEMAAQLVKKMSLMEKVNVTTGTGWMMGPCVGNTGPAVEVGFPALCLQDGPLGLRWADHITASPAAITVGATFNKELMYKRGRMLGLEARMKGVNVLLGPSVGPLGRMPAGGRNFEGFGSDPVLQGIAAAETIKGIQEEGVMATIKHLVGNEQEHFRQSFEWGLPNALSANMDDRTLHELYVWPFAEAVRAGVTSVMCSYNQVNNSYACQNSKLLNGILKDELGFQGFVQSDWLAQRSGVASALAGLDMSMPGDGLKWMNGKSFWGPQLTTAALNGSLPMDRLDDMVTRIVAAWYQVGQDDRKRWPPAPPDSDGGPNFSSWTNDEAGLLRPGSDDTATGVVNKFVDAANSGSFSHRSLARRIAAEGIVLLKNEHQMLPLSRAGPSQKEKGSIALDRKFRVGVFGEDSVEAEGGPNACPDRACNKGTLGSGWGSGTVEFPYLVTPLEAMQQFFYNQTVEIFSYPTNDLPSKQNLSSVTSQDLCIVFANSDAGEGYVSWGGIRGDRNDLSLQKGGDALIRSIAGSCGSVNGDATGNTIVVLHSVGPVILESFIDDPRVGAVLLANLPGQESGHALVDVLFGDVNPSGHLPYTIGKTLSDYGDGGQILYYPNGVVPQQDFDEGLFIDYRWFDELGVVPRYEFGYGLSYTSFHIKTMIVKPKDNSRPPRLPPPRPADESAPPEYSSKLPHPDEALFPKGWRKLKKYIYPYIGSISDVEKGQYPYPDMTPLPLSQAGGGQGGNPALWEPIVEIELMIENTGDRDGQAVVQLYVVFPSDVYEDASGDEEMGTREATPKRDFFGSGSSEGIAFPKRVLRAFEKVSTFVEDEHATGEATVKMQLTRRDLSYWSVREQNWVLPQTGSFGLEVGLSSRDIRIKGTVH